jgi:hypothetical protein
MSRQGCSSTSARRGTTLLECVVALGLLAAAFTLGAQALGWSAAQRRLADERHIAVQEAANCLQRVRHLNWDELTDERLASQKLSSHASELLASAELRVTAADAGGEPAGRRIHAEVSWVTRHGGTPLQIGLVTWRYRTNHAE